MNSKALDLGPKTIALIQRLADEEQQKRAGCPKYVRSRRGRCGACGTSISKHSPAAMESFRAGR